MFRLDGDVFEKFYWRNKLLNPWTLKFLLMPFHLEIAFKLRDYLFPTSFQKCVFSFSCNCLLFYIPTFTRPSTVVLFLKTWRWFQQKPILLQNDTAIFLSSVKLNIRTLDNYRIQGIKELTMGKLTLSHDMVWHIINIQCVRIKKWNEHNYTYNENLLPLTEVKLTSFKLRQCDSPPRIWEKDVRD